MGAKATPTFDESTNTITFPDVEGVVYKVSGQPVRGELKIEKKTHVRVAAEVGKVLAKSVQTDHVFAPAKKEDAEVTPPEDDTVETEPVVVSGDATVVPDGPGEKAQRPSTFGQGHRPS